MQRRGKRVAAVDAHAREARERALRARELGGIVEEHVRHRGPHLEVRAHVRPAQRARDRHAVLRAGHPVIAHDEQRRVAPRAARIEPGEQCAELAVLARELHHHVG